MHPAATTRRANTANSGLMPGASLMMTTAGPLPSRKTARSLPSASKLSLVKSESVPSHLPTSPVAMAGP